MKHKTVWVLFGDESVGDSIVSFGDTLDTQKPMVTADPRVAEIFLSLAQKIANETGRKMTLAKFTVRKDIELFVPQAKP